MNFMDLLIDIMPMNTPLENVLSIIVTQNTCNVIVTCTCSSVVFTMNSTDHVNVFFSKSVYRLTIKVTTSPNSIYSNSIASICMNINFFGKTSCISSIQYILTWNTWSGFEA